jgi:hypothetical protein
MHMCMCIAGCDTVAHAQVQTDDGRYWITQASSTASAKGVFACRRIYANFTAPLEDLLSTCIETVCLDTATTGLVTRIGNTITLATTGYAVLRVAARYLLRSRLRLGQLPELARRRCKLQPLGRSDAPIADPIRFHAICGRGERIIALLVVCSRQSGMSIGSGNQSEYFRCLRSCTYTHERLRTRLGPTDRQIPLETRHTGQSRRTIARAEEASLVWWDADWVS